MNQPAPMNTTNTPGAPGTPPTKESRWNGAFFLTLFLGLIGLVVLSVIASIVVDAVKNKGLIPPPNTLKRYDCSGPVGNFSLQYLHGTDHVKIKSAQGILEGKVHQNQLDWGNFSNDASILGFLPPSEISFENAQTLRLKGAQLPEVSCIAAPVKPAAKPETPAQ